MAEWAPLPADNASKVRALEGSGGTGLASVQLAWMGLEGVLLDDSEQMLGMARQQSKGPSVAGFGMRPEFAANARYIQVIARRSCASFSEVVGP
jgi:hypothetical protein